MAEVRFNLSSEAEKPLRCCRKRSEYDPILDAFTAGKDRLVEVSVTGEEANYLRMQLDMRIDARNLRGIKVSVKDNVCYLEK